MASFNKVILIGNLTRDPELKYTPKGTAACQIGMAVNRKWRNEQGQDQEEVTFLDVQSWGKQAEAISKYLRKGSPLFVEGRLKLEEWEKDGKKQSKLRVVLESFQFLGGAKQEGAPRAASAAPAASPDGPASADDDVPF
jgi:single-strand DNA-binding protein